MKEIIISIGMLTSMSCNQVDQDSLNQATIQLNTTIDNIQDMKEWMIEDQVSGHIEWEYAEYYIEYLNESEALLIDFAESCELKITK
tara:strand:+ start:34 stop:294 length:261 start_codon:yes stop_codon:yes gene_type:complete